MSKPFVKKGNSPKNARIKINYEGVKPKVRFSYPCKKRQISGSMFFPILVFWVLFLILIGMIHGIYLGVTERAQELDYVCVDKIEEYAKNNLTEIKNRVCSNLNSFEILNEGLWTNFKDNFYQFRSKGNQLKSFLLILWIFLPPFLIYLPFRKFWANVFPKYQAFWARKKIRKFNSKDVEFKEGVGYYCEVPVFNNIVLNFEATKEFSKYLKEFEIREHNFRYYQTRRTFHKKRRILKIKKRRPPKTFNEFVWYARFYFTEKPRTGSLEVLFK